MDRSSRLSDQVPGERLGQAPTSLAVAGGVGGDRGELLIVAALLESIHGLIARLVRGKDLGEEDAQGDPRRVDSIAPAMVETTASRLDRGPGEEPEEGESLLLAELLAQGLELVARGRGGRLNHGGLLGVGMVGVSEPPRYHPRRSLLSHLCVRMNLNERRGLGYPRAIRVRSRFRLESKGSGANGTRITHRD